MNFTARMMAIRVLPLVILLLPGLSYAWEKDTTYQITILHTNDHHGRFWQNDQGEYGLSAQKTLVDQIRWEVLAAGGSLLLLSGGDINTGVPESDLQDAEPDFRGMSLVGYDAMAVGNHEFDNPLSVLRQQEKWANFPLLSANIYQKGTEQRLFQPYAIFNKQQIKIAVIGLTTDDTAKIGNPEYLQDIEFRAPAEEAKRLIEQLRKDEQPDIVIAATHMGHYDNGKHGSNAPGDVEMARQLPAGYLDLIVGGHSHDPVCMAREDQKQRDYVPGTPCAPDRQNGTWIVQAHEWGKYVGRADFTFRNGQLQLQHYQLIPVNLKKQVTDADGHSEFVYYTWPIEQNQQALTLLTPFQEKGQAGLLVKIGTVDDKLEGDRKKVRFQQTNLGRLVLLAQLERTNADFAVMSGGGIRDSIAPGDITYRDVLKVQPFGNTLTYVEMKGHEVVDYLAVVANKKVGSGGYAQLANVSLIADGSGVKQVMIKGKPLQAEDNYRMTLLSFNAAGGDDYPKVTDNPTYINTGFVDAEVLKYYIETHSPLKAEDYQPKGEIVYQ